MTSTSPDVRQSTRVQHISGDSSQQPNMAMKMCIQFHNNMDNNEQQWTTLDNPQDCPPQNCPLGGNPEVGNSESISHQDCPPQLLCFFMNCLCSIWALGECWGLRQCIQSQYFEEQSNSCDYWRHLKTHSGKKSNKCVQ